MMNSKARHSPTLATQNQGPQGPKGAQSRTPRTMPVTYAESMAISSAAMADEYADSNFSLTSSSPGSYGYPSSRPGSVSSESYPDSDDFLLRTTSAISYCSLSASDSNFPMPVMSGLGVYDSDPTYEFLADQVLSSNSPPDLNLVPSNYPGHTQPQDYLASTYISMDGPMYSAGMMNTFCSPDIPWQNGALTPPPEDYVQDFLSAQNFQEDSCQSDRDFSVFVAHDTSKSPAFSRVRRSVIQPRPIRSASERSDPSGEPRISVEVRTPKDRTPKEEPLDKLKARSDPLYEAKPDEQGLYHCPWANEQKCSHRETKQKCIYNKYLDSHLRPYRCKFVDKGECEDARFSSNACLFRHEREAHGLHNHGLNPFLCKYQDCDRSREGNGFPRRWNQRDHMKRVHDYKEPESTKDCPAAPDQGKRRKAPGVPTSTPMKRSSSSAQAKVQAMASAPYSPRFFGRTINQARYSAPRTSTVQSPDCSAMPCHVSLNVQFSPSATIPRTSTGSHTYPRSYSS